MASDVRVPGVETLADQKTPGTDPPASEMKKVALAGFIGSVIEFYDFAIYGFAAALVFGHVFFPALGPAAATIASFATLGVAFVARPVGAIIFGHFGDRLGRKKTLIATLIMMGVATVVVGIMPTADQIGIAAPIILVVLRIVQGLAAGGEYAGAALFVSENAPSEKRGFWAMFAALGGGVAIFMAPLTFLLIGFSMSEEAFLSYGWRLPFLASIFLVAIGLWIRLSMDETPVFKAEQQQDAALQLPVVEVFKRQPKVLILSCGVWSLVSTTGYLGATFLTKYGTTTLELSRNSVLAMGAVGGLFYSIGLVLGGNLSDRFGRRRIVIAAAVAAAATSLALFPLLDLGTVFVLGVGMSSVMFISGIAGGPLGAYMSELFHTRYRYTGLALSNSVGTVVGGGIMPIVGVAIAAAYGGFAFGLALAGVAVVSLLCVLGLPETRNGSLTEDGPAPMQ